MPSIMCLISLQACHVCGLIYKYLETRCDEFLANVDLQRKKVYTVRTAFGWSPSHGCERLEIHRRICVKAICKKCFEMDPATNAMSIYGVHFGCRLRN